MLAATDDAGKSSTEQVPSAANSTTQKEDKVEETMEDLEREVSKVPGNPSCCYGWPYGDGPDHDHEPQVGRASMVTGPPLRADLGGVPQMTAHRFMSLVGMALLWTSSQIPAYLFGMSSFSIAPSVSNPRKL